MVKYPGDYQWSSYRRHALGIGDTWLVDHACYLALGRDVESRQTAYQALFQHPLVVEELSTIRGRINRSGILGSERFQEDIAVVLGRPGAAWEARSTAADTRLFPSRINNRTLTPISPISGLGNQLLLFQKLQAQSSHG